MFVFEFSHFVVDKANATSTEGCQKSPNAAFTGVENVKGEVPPPCLPTGLSTDH